MSIAHRYIKIIFAFIACALILTAAADSAAKLKWYEGGTLHKLTALDWQKATYANKLATCADFVAHAWVNKMLKNNVAGKLQTVDDLRPYAVDLVAFLDAATKPEKNARKNQRLVAKQEVSELAAQGMLLMEWLK